MWHIHDTEHAKHNPTLLRALGDPIFRIYKALDNGLARVVQAAGPEASVVFVTGPGMRANYTANGHIDEILRRLVQPMVLRRLKTDPKVITDLPPCVQTKEYAHLTPEQASEVVEAWISHAGVKVVIERDEHWRILRSYLEQTGMAGNLTTDAHLASLAVSYGAALVSCDGDFSRFSELRWENPLVG